MLNDRDEYGIICLKPDGIQKKGLYDTVISKLKEKQLLIVKERELLLSRRQIQFFFNSIFKTDLYESYLSRGKVRVILAKGENAAYKLRRIKVEVRALFGLNSSTMENLLHSVDHGCEYYEQFHLFFPELSNTFYSGYADLTIDMEMHLHQSQKLIEKLESQTNISWCGLIFQCDPSLKQLELQSEKIKILYGIKKPFKYENRDIHLIGYFLWENRQLVEEAKDLSLYDFIGYFKQNHGAVILDYLEKKHLSVPFLKKLDKRLMLDGIVLYDPRRSLQDAEDLEEIIEDNTNIKFCGGSSGLVAPGSMSIGKRDFIKFTKRSNLMLKDYQYEL